MSSIDPQALKELISLHSKFPLDKILYEELTPITHVVGGATPSGGIYLPKTDILTIDNPIGKKAFITMKWSIDGINYYPQKPFIYQPGNPVPAGKVGATVGCGIDDDHINFYFVHYLAASQTFRIIYVLDSIL